MPEPISLTPPAAACAILTITTDRGTIEAWVVFDDLHTAQARFVEAPTWPEATKYIMQADGNTSAVAGRGRRWYVVRDSGEVTPWHLAPAELTYAADLRRACEAALVMNGSHS
jgi:hypothetical protein